MAQIEKEHAGSGVDKPAPRTIREKISDRVKSRLGAGMAKPKAPTDMLRPGAPDDRGATIDAPAPQQAQSIARSG